MYTISLNTKGIDKVIDNLDSGAQYFFTERLMNYADEYTPIQTGILKNTAYVENGGRAIIYPQPYARYLYYGKLMVDPDYQIGAFHNELYGFGRRRGVKKQLTDIDLQFNGAPMRGAFWVDRAFIDNKYKLIEETKDFILGNKK